MPNASTLSTGSIHNGDSTREFLAALERERGVVRAARLPVWHSDPLKRPVSPAEGAAHRTILALAIGLSGDDYEPAR